MHRCENTSKTMGYIGRSKVNVQTEQLYKSQVLAACEVREIHYMLHVYSMRGIFHIFHMSRLETVNLDNDNGLG